MQLPLFSGSFDARRFIFLLVAVTSTLVIVSIFYVHGGSLDPQLYHQSLTETFTDLKASASQALEAWKEPESLNALDDDVFTKATNEPLPRIDFSKFEHEEPLNMEQFSLDRRVFATLYCSRNNNPRDPYLAAVQSVIWRLLWSPYASKHPVVVFVCPFVRNEERYLFRAQGAWVEELDLIQIDLVQPLGWGRWADQYAKLNFWKYTQFDRIAFLDTDAFPMANPDRLFDLAKVQHCKPDLLSDEEDLAAYASAGDKFCDYVFAGVPWANPYSPLPYSEINGGLLVIQPNLNMHARLLRNARRVEEYDTATMEQGFLSSSLAFNPNSAFPYQTMSPVFNFGPPFYDQLGPSQNGTHDPTFELFTPGVNDTIPGNAVVVVHNKLWIGIGPLTNDPERPYWLEMWFRDWMKMCRTYDSPFWPRSRKMGRRPTDEELMTWSGNSERFQGYNG